MDGSSRGEITELLVAWSGGEQTALAKLTPLVYGELHRLARGYMRRERPEHSLQATALVNEAYLKLVDSSRVHWRNRAHFIAMAAQLMRRILVDYARNRRYQKRSGAFLRVTFAEAQTVSAGAGPDLVALDDALQELARLDPRKARVVELRFFGGLSLNEISEVLRVSSDTLGRDWTATRAWLLRELTKK